MVPLTTAAPIQQRELIRSVDRAVKDLLISDNDPLALAIYLWTIRHQGIQLVNGDGLANWGVQWIEHILIDGQTGRRRDEDIVSAALAALSLWGSSVLADLEVAVTEQLGQVVASELDMHPIPFRHASYAVVFLLAAHVTGVSDPRIPTAARSAAQDLRSAISGGRVFGMGYAVLLLQRVQATDNLAALEYDLQIALADPTVADDDRLYLAQAGLLLRTKHDANDPLVLAAEQVLAGSPMWTYLMSGADDVTPSGDGKTVVHVSHLYRAALLDVQTTLEVTANSRANALLDAKYSGRRGITILAFGFVLTLLAGVGAGLAVPLARGGPSARQYWLMEHFGAMPVLTALLYLAGVIVATYYVVIAPVILYTTWQMLVRSSVESDRRILEANFQRLKVVSIGWLGLFGLAVLVNLSTGVLSAGLGHAIHPGSP